ncbi:hypothetical protein Hanom_Chr01g00021141 [Helianthus anomalus]
MLKSGVGLLGRKEICEQCYQRYNTYDQVKVISVLHVICETNYTVG